MERMFQIPETRHPSSKVLSVSRYRPLSASLTAYPLLIEDHWQVMYRGGFYRGGPELMSAIAGIDQALWDIKGKYYNAPVYELLGGKCRDKLMVYSWVGGDRPKDVLKGAMTYMSPAAPH